MLTGFVILVVAVIIAIVALIAYGVLIEIKWFEVTEPELHIHGLDDAFQNYRIAHISDIHMDSSMTRERLTQVAGLVAEQSPDLIVITGDFVSYEVEFVTDDLHDALAEFDAPDGVVAVTGNHDHLSGVDRVRSVLADVGIHELRNDCMRIERDGSHFYLCGVDDVSAKQARLDQLLENLPDDAPAILLAHEPDFADVAAATGRFEAQLSGHTHAGQVKLPFNKILYGPEHGHRYQEGMYDVLDPLQLYVTRGVGTVMYPIRINCRPEITMLSLQPINPTPN